MTRSLERPHPGSRFAGSRSTKGPFATRVGSVSAGLAWVLVALTGCSSERQGDDAVPTVAAGTDTGASGAPPAAGAEMSPVAGGASPGGAGGAPGNTNVGMPTSGSNENGAPVTGLAGGTNPAGPAGQAGTTGNGDTPGTTICAEMVSAANGFIGGLGQDAALRGLALMDFDAREHFKFTPGERPGVPLRELNEGQRALALALVSTGLSENGLTKAEVTRQNELVLRAQ
jgi:hypothetical protein